jgi:outer membrane protein
MKFLKKIKFIIIVLIIFQNPSVAEIPYFIDFKYILNQSEAGKKAQKFLKDKLSGGIEKIKNKEKSIQDDEKKIIQQKKIISADEYKKKVTDLRKKVSSLRLERNKLLDDVAKQRAKAREELLKNLNPILKEYMKEKDIRMIIDKKSMLLADENLDITKDVIKILNQKLKSIKLN